MKHSETTIAHLSDVHLAPIAGFWPHHWNAKRFLGFANWAMRRRRSHLRAVVDMLVADLRRQQVDHILVSGDLVNIGLPQEYENALVWLHSLGAPDHVSVVPGNHDIYTRLRRHSGVARWAPYMTSDAWGAAMAPGQAPHFPYVRRIGDVALVGLNSAVPTPPGVASGELGREQIEACRAILQQLGHMPVFRLVMIHHPPLRTEPLHPGRDLKDAAELEAVLIEAGADLVVHGHNHRDMVNWRETVSGPMPVVGIASSSIGRIHRYEPLARYNLYKIGGSRAEGWRIELTGRGIRSPDGPVVQVERRILLPDLAEERQVG